MIKINCPLEKNPAGTTKKQMTSGLVMTSACSSSLCVSPYVTSSGGDFKCLLVVDLFIIFFYWLAVFL